MPAGPNGSLQWTCRASPAPSTRSLPSCFFCISFVAWSHLPVTLHAQSSTAICQPPQDCRWHFTFFSSLNESRQSAACRLMASSWLPWACRLDFASFYPRRAVQPAHLRRQRLQAIEEKEKSFGRGRESSADSMQAAAWVCRLITMALGSFIEQAGQQLKGEHKA